MSHCSGHCVVTEYRQTNIVITEWSGVTDDGRDVGSHPIDKKWTFYKGWLKAFEGGLAAHWVEEDDCGCCNDDDDCTCDTGDNKPGPWHRAAKPLKFRQPVKFPGYKSFFIHGTYVLEYRFTDGICLGDPGREDEGRMLMAWIGDTAVMARDSGAAAALKEGKGSGTAKKR